MCYYDDEDLGVRSHPDSSHDDALNVIHGALEHTANFLDRTGKALEEHMEMYRRLVVMMVRLHGRDPSGELDEPRPFEKLLTGCPDWDWADGDYPGRQVDVLREYVIEEILDVILAVLRKLQDPVTSAAGSFVDLRGILYRAACAAEQSNLPDDAQSLRRDPRALRLLLKRFGHVEPPSLYPTDEY